jgi:alkylation response protein AidB-like acyl-CoA dehydrogenase
MDLNETMEERSFRSETRAWLGEHTPPPLAPELAGSDSDLAYRRIFAQALFDAGYAAVDWPRRYGGLGLGLVHKAIWNEEWARARAPETFQNAIDLLGPTLLACGTPEQCDRYLRPLLTGEETWCQGFSEPDAGSDLAALRTRAELGSDGRWRVSGQKVWTSHARWAEWCFVLARTSSEPNPHRGITFLLVPMDQPGIEVRPLRQMTGDDDRFAEVFFEGAIAEDVVGEIDDGWRVAMTTLGHERFTRTFWLQMNARNELDALREMIGPVRDPVMRQRLAGLESSVAILRWLLLRDLSRLQAGAQLGAEGSLHKALWSDLDQRLHQVATDVRGLAAVTGDADRWQQRMLYTRAETIFAGSSEIQRNIIAERILGLPR